ncbi:MAG: sugar ABC transporter permease, partial [Lachnospiraceae bacterium]|nr:sugar ABC transporter permease [Lachnospiraceae bacterium]
MRKQKSKSIEANGLMIPQKSFGERLKRDLKKNKSAYLLFLPVLIYYLVFHYKPMYGLLIAFK